MQPDVCPAGERTRAGSVTKPRACAYSNQPTVN